MSNGLKSLTCKILVKSSLNILVNHINTLLQPHIAKYNYIVRSVLQLYDDGRCSTREKLSPN